MAKVLVIDEDSSMGGVISRILTVRGHEAVEAVSMRNGSELLIDTRFDLVITDQSKPVQDEAIRQVRALDADIPIIAISGMSGTGSLSKRDDALAMGADRTVEEPFTVEKLIAAVDDMLDRDRERP